MNFILNYNFYHWFTTGILISLTFASACQQDTGGSTFTTGCLSLVRNKASRLMISFLLYFHKVIRIIWIKYYCPLSESTLGNTNERCSSFICCILKDRSVQCCSLSLFSLESPPFIRAVHEGKCEVAHHHTLVLKSAVKCHQKAWILGCRLFSFWWSFSLLFQ